MKELEIEFKGIGEVSDFTFKQIACSNRGYVFEISDSNDKLHYEVFERKEQQKSDTVISGMKVSFPAKVLYPKSGSFGVWAWTFKCLDKAIQRLNSL